MTSQHFHLDFEGCLDNKKNIKIIDDTYEAIFTIKKIHSSAD